MADGVTSGGRVADGVTTGSEVVDAEAAGALGGGGGAGSPGGHCGGRAGYAFEVVKVAPCESCDHFGVPPHLRVSTDLPQASGGLPSSPLDIHSLRPNA